MATPIEIVRSFFKAWGPSRTDLIDALRTYLAEGAVWENVGLGATHGPDQAVTLMEQFGSSSGFVAFDVDLLHIAAESNFVLTERIDYAIRADGSRSATGIRVMGAFEIKDGKIAAWRDYFDTAPFLSKDKK